MGDAVGLFQLQAGWPGTLSLSRILPGIQRAAQTVSGVYLNVFVRAVGTTNAPSALWVLNDYAL